MRRITGWLTAALLAGIALPNVASAQKIDGPIVQAAADKFATGVVWRSASVLEADFSCAGKVQQAILGTWDKEIVVAIFTQGIHQPPALLHFDASDRKAQASKIRVDDYNLTADEIAGVSGDAPVGYRPSTSCHGIRLSDDSYEAAHIYWNHDQQRFDTWSQ
ncbi:hypothetical protein [Massilia sp. S19_KUP03_FR1]|uniref:hypothetical protein n=1 Tax=Massilia sp. S19_KUP03_FR1 TaxID=3025503 RepID=UPI002FCD9DF8